MLKLWANSSNLTRSTWSRSSSLDQGPFPGSYRVCASASSLLRVTPGMTPFYPDPGVDLCIELDCTTCGACCVPVSPDQPFFAETTWTDENRLGRPFVRLNVVRPTVPGLTARGFGVPHGAIRTTEVDGRRRCAALEGTVGERCRCTVYRKRPKVCRSSCEPGDRTCLNHRARLGIQ